MPVGNLFRGIDRDVAAGGETTLSVTGIAALVSALRFTARHIIVKWSALASAGNPDVSLRINGNSSALYNAQDVKGAGGSDTALRTNAATSLPLGTLSSTAFEFSGGEIIIPAAFLATHKSVVGLYGEVENNVAVVGGRYASADVIDEISLTISSGSYVAASVLEVGVADEMFAIAGAEDIKTADGTFTVQGIPQLSGDVVLIGNLRTDRSSDADAVDMQINGDSVATNYFRQDLQGFGGSTFATSQNNDRIGFATADTAVANSFAPFVTVISNPAGGVNDPHDLTLSGFHADSGSSAVTVNSSRRDNVETVESLVVQPEIGTNFLAGSMLSAYFVPKNVIAREVVEVAKDTITIDLSDLQGYRDIRLKTNGRTDEGAALSSLQIQLNSDATAANYDTQRLDGNGSSVTATPQTNDRTLYEIPGGNAPANVVGGGDTTIFEYADATKHKHLLSIAGAAEDIVEIDSMSWSGGPAAVTQIVLTIAGGANFDVGFRAEVEGIGKTRIGWEDDNVILPTVKVEVDWGDDGYGDAIDDITSTVFFADGKHGRDFASQLAGKAVAGSLELQVNNKDDRYNKFNDSSPLFGLLLPKRKIRISSVSPAAQYFWQGEIQNVRVNIDKRGKKTARILAIGALGTFPADPINVAHQTAIGSGAAMDLVLDAADWASADRDIDTGKLTMGRWWVDDLLPLTAMRRIEASEAGFTRESHKLGSRIAFEDRHHRLKEPHTTSQASFSDSATGVEFDYSAPFGHDDPSKNVFNHFKALVRDYTVESIADLWTMQQEPVIPPNQSREYWVDYPSQSSVKATDAIGVDVWTTPASGTDYTGGSSSGQTDVTGDLTVTAVKFATAVRISVENTTDDPVYLSLLKIRGTAVTENDPVSVVEESAASIAKYRTQKFDRDDSAVWISDLDEARNWALFQLAIYDEPTPILQLSYVANVDLYRYHEALRRDVSDRISVDATAKGFGIDEGFFVEAISFSFGIDRIIQMTYDLSPAAAFSTFWVIGKSKLGTETRIAY